MSNLNSHAAADNLRCLAAAMVEKANSGHPGGAMGGADFSTILFSEYMTFDPDNMDWHLRDRFFLDPGHMSAMLYAQQTFFGNYTIDDIKNFRQWGSPTPGHPEIDVKRGIENTSGPLGLGHAFGAGSAIGERFMTARFGEAVGHNTFMYISDGGIQEEISQGVGRIAGHLGLSNLVMFYDANDIQLSTEVDDVTSEDTAKKYEAWGWNVVTIVGNDHDAIRGALDQCIAESERPSLIIGKTIMGKGAIKDNGESFEGEVSTHGQPLGKSQASFADSIKNLGGNPDNPFEIKSEVAAHYQDVVAKLKQKVEAKQAKYNYWKKENTDLAARYEGYLANPVQDLDWSSIQQKADTATRNSSGSVLAFLAENTDNVIVSSADLCNSDKTEFFLKKSSQLTKGDFSGGFLQAGVSELTMGALCTGIALHGGIVPICATFFAFSDYMKPVIRVAALMETPVVFMYTHDSFRVGEDGPTHQPIEQEAQIRLLEKLQNHSHRNALVVLRPADSNETTVSWQVAYENRNSPTCLIFTRQNVETLPGSSYEMMQGARKGGYVISSDEGFDTILLASGSEVSTLEGAAKILRSKGRKIRVVSVPSEGLLSNQDDNYRDDLLPKHIFKVGLTAGLSINLAQLVGENGYVKGNDHFGYSAPASELDERFGFTPEKAAAMIEEVTK